MSLRGAASYKAVGHLPLDETQAYVVLRRTLDTE
jgi:hypothetical protein